MVNQHTSGVISGGHTETVAAGAEMLKQGGNAIDAAVAAAFASFVAESLLVNIGGGGIAQVYAHSNQSPIVYDFFSNMPGLSPKIKRPITEIDFQNVILDFGGSQESFFVGRGSVAVHGAVAGLCKMIEEMGTLSLAQILAPAINLARKGVLVGELDDYILSTVLKPILTHTPQIKDIYAPGGRMAKTGDWLYFPELARTLEQLAQDGASLFYTGAVAEKILVDQAMHGGLLTETDLTTYEIYRLNPLQIDYRDYTLCLPPLPSNGGLFIAFAFKLLEMLSFEIIPHHSIQHFRGLIETIRLTNVARREWEENCRASLISDEQATTLLLNDDNISRYHRKLQKALSQNITMPEPTFPHGPSNTTHISAADENNMVVGITLTAGEGAGFVVDDTGVRLNNMLGESDLNPCGFHSLPAGKRLATMMSPMFVFKNDAPILVTGSGGSTRIRTAILQVVNNVLDFNLPLATAVAMPRFHFEEGISQLEGDIAKEIADQLEQHGYVVNRWDGQNLFFGGTHTVSRDGSIWHGTGDQRRGGAVAVVC
ncbi:MAG: hypothetical protein B6242_16935 [Anaerolineaceae bacterium 4572_78]|nr:MAG: hypothetical protein B6242_16935 [Anaerolineaceae bacterium 4572_78]